MRKVLSTLVLMVAMLAGGAGMAHATSQLPPCPEEDSINCYWDASERGNGEGQSFTDIEGVAHYWSDDVAAWELFDAVGAAELLPESYATVTFAGDYDGHALSASEIAVWHADGTAYLFTIS